MLFLNAGLTGEGGRAVAELGVKKVEYGFARGGEDTSGLDVVDLAEGRARDTAAGSRDEMTVGIVISGGAIGAVFDLAGKRRRPGPPSAATGDSTDMTKLLTLTLGDPAIVGIREAVEEEADGDRASSAEAFGWKALPAVRTRGGRCRSIDETGSAVSAPIAGSLPTEDVGRCLEAVGASDGAGWTGS